MLHHTLFQSGLPVWVLVFKPVMRSRFSFLWMRSKAIWRPIAFISVLCSADVMYKWKSRNWSKPFCTRSLSKVCQQTHKPLKWALITIYPKKVNLYTFPVWYCTITMNTAACTILHLTFFSLNIVEGFSPVSHGYIWDISDGHYDTYMHISNC